MPLIDMLRSWYKRLNPRERGLWIIFAAALCAFFYFNSFLKPTFSRITQLKKQEQETKNKMQLLTSQFPDLVKTGQEIEDIKKSGGIINLAIDDTQTRLIRISQGPQLLAALMECDQGLTIDFQSVKQKTETDKDGFSRLFVDLKFGSSFEDMIQYIKRIEEISAFVKIEEVDVIPSKTDVRNVVNASLTLSTILSDELSPPGELSLTGLHDSGTKLSVKHNPFLPRFALGQAKKKTLKLTGITYSRLAKASTAIVNGAVIRVGGEIEGQKVEKILSDSIVVNDGTESYTVKLERE